ncbi:MAG: hypothetical protein KBD57_03040 [Bacteroidia bacterium]|nr:hypothetical protein [Bacteroidia bacterium]
MPTHLQQMLQLVDEFFSVKNDPSQLDVTPIVMEQLNELHPLTLSEEVIGDGPVCWILLIPSTLKTMEEFLSGKISESDILNQSIEEKKTSNNFEAIYLCSAIVLPEFRKKGIAKKVTLEAVAAMRKDFDIKFVYSWPFSEEGKKLSALIGELTELPLKMKN